MGPLLQMLMFKIVPMKSPALMRPLVRPIFSGLISQVTVRSLSFDRIFQ